MPFSLKSLEEAIRRSVSAGGPGGESGGVSCGPTRHCRPERSILTAEKVYSYASLLEEKAAFSSSDTQRPRRREITARLVDEAVLELNIDDETHRDLALRAYDLIQYDGLALARRYLERVKAVRAKDRRQWGFSATKAAMRYAFKVMAIKDEVYVAHLLTSPEKRARDRARFRIDEANGDRLELSAFESARICAFRQTYSMGHGDARLAVASHEADEVSASPSAVLAPGGKRISRLVSRARRPL